MGSSKKHQIDGGKWVIDGIAIPLRSISTKPEEVVGEDDDDTCSTTPTAKESRIPEKLRCPPPPRKPRPSPSSSCHYGGVREFFSPPDLESVFKRHVERAN